MSVTRQPEPCISCGEDTSAGTPFFSDRLVDRSGNEERYLCSLCAQRAKGSHKIHEMSEEERKKLENAAFVFGSFAPGGH
jgi:hypothetical protein